MLRGLGGSSGRVEGVGALVAWPEWPERPGAAAAELGRGRCRGAGCSGRPWAQLRVVACFLAFRGAGWAVCRGREPSARPVAARRSCAAAGELALAGVGQGQGA